ncbi:unnamed protein product [Albugo candida]|uniref:MTHFR SAM-binding regulatory domain-containing protein n=1 Tax=Albugo candida TaxID=65357 RepID=A0A024GR41_9STRA|nr:unnamed protein product [Albugo candida]|eukprot:CCI49003.1 unnamed protein product [Albugo candida]
MSRIITSIQSTYQQHLDLTHKSTARPRPTISFEYFPAKTEDGIFNLLNRIEEMGFTLQPTFVTLTWRSAFKDASLWLRIGAHIQKCFELNVLMHLTCHLSRESIREILIQAREMGICNILALRGDPPIGKDRWVANRDGFNNAVDLIQFIRQEHGDYFCIACAGYPEVHTEAWNQPEYLPPSKEAKSLDLERLKMKQDAGADFIITQFFFDVDNLLCWVQDCRTAGITIPILPGYLPIQNYNSFVKFTQWCKTRVPGTILKTLDTIQNDDTAVKEYGTRLAIETCERILKAGIPSLHFYTMNLATTVTKILCGLDLIPSPSERELPWHTTILRRNVTKAVAGKSNSELNEKQMRNISDGNRESNGHLRKSKDERVRPIFWSNRQASYIARTSGWDDYPNGRWGDRTSPAYGEISEYYLAFKRPKLNRLEMWGKPASESDVWNVFVRFLSGQVTQLPWCEQALSKESSFIREKLKWINQHGFLTINSQPRVNGASSRDSAVGWGGADGFVFQKAYVEFFCSPLWIHKLLKAMEAYPTLSYHALDRQGNEFRNKPADSVTAVTWGVFPGREVLQPTIVDTSSFGAWKDEAFELWQTQWATLYEKDSETFQVIQAICSSYFLVNIVDHDYTNENSDIFRIFTQLIADEMSKEALHDRMFDLEHTNERLHENVTQLIHLQDTLMGDLKQAHAGMESLRRENDTLALRVRQLESQLASPQTRSIFT